ncbi:uncharacterized protein LOC127120800 isoform X1 [Lathyrus oleraceus]|uniref:uncharacterized protein LOC127120800 isoform X1 n=1 Tax=Pisum sativum TaxID=3888 RepID=UPI0021CEC7B3|nr:uncharacterized protein LOC127120800 isoform X1 [Pisum sativum]
MQEQFGAKTFLIYVEPVFSKTGETIGVNYMGMEITNQVRKRERMAKLREEIAVQKAKETELNKTIHITGMHIYPPIYRSCLTRIGSRLSETEVKQLMEAVEELRLKQRVVDGKRRQALSKILDIKGSIKCFVGFDRIFRKRREEIMNLYQLNQREFELSLVGQGKSMRLIRFFIKIQLKKVFLLKWSQF